MLTFSQRMPAAFKKFPPADDSPLSDIERYELKRCLGRGSYGFVRLAIDRTTGEKVAIKFWPRDSDYMTIELQRELHNHSTFHHPNVIQFRQVVLTRSHIGLVMEYASGGDLFKRVENSGCLPESEARQLFQQLLLGLDYCHKMGVANRDIKLENVLLSGKKSPFVPKLADFGFCKSDRESMAKTMRGTPFYMAPEVLRGGSYNAKKADIFSFGIMLYIMLYAQFPFKQWADTLTRDISFPELPQISDAAKDLMRSMVSREVSKRVELDAICQHPWVAQGLPPNYLSANEKYINASTDLTRPQSVEEMDAILLQAGLQVMQREQSNGSQSNASTSTSAAPPGGQNQGNGRAHGEDMEW